MAADLHALRPADTPAYMTDAWLGCVRWALGEPEIVEAFRGDTGMTWRPATTPIERSIDEATGADWAYLKAFIKWANVHVWGPISGGPMSSRGRR